MLNRQQGFLEQYIFSTWCCFPNLSVIYFHSLFCLNQIDKFLNSISNFLKIYCSKDMLICFSKTKIYYVDLELIKSTQKNYKYKTWQKGYIIFKDISYSQKKNLLRWTTNIKKRRTKYFCKFVCISSIHVIVVNIFNNKQTVIYRQFLSCLV